MTNNIVDHGEYWIYSGMEPEIGEHWFVELTIEDFGKRIFIQADFFDDEYTLSASEDSARVFFEENFEGDTELPRMTELFDEIPIPEKSCYAAEYRMAKALLDRERGMNTPTWNLSK